MPLVIGPCSGTSEHLHSCLLRRSAVLAMPPHVGQVSHRGISVLVELNTILKPKVCCLAIPLILLYAELIETLLPDPRDARGVTYTCLQSQALHLCPRLHLSWSWGGMTWCWETRPLCIQQPPGPLSGPAAVLLVKHQPDPLRSCFVSGI